MHAVSHFTQSSHKIYRTFQIEEEEEDQIQGEDKDTDNEQKTPQTNPRFFAAMVLTLQPPKPSITEYFGTRSSVTPVMDTPKEENRCYTIVTSQEHKDQNQDTLEDKCHRHRIWVKEKMERFGCIYSNQGFWHGCWQMCR